MDLIEEKKPSPRAISLRRIEARDRKAILKIIKTVMPEFGASGEGFAINDSEVNDMPSAYQGNRSAYYVVCIGNRVVGGGGIAPLEGGDASVCELRKMYFLPEVRGKRMGQKLLNYCLGKARELGYRDCYLETLTQMTAARKLYEKNGFVRIDAPVGKTGHHGCDTWYLKPL